jgi:hypothetical protein
MNNDAYIPRRYTNRTRSAARAFVLKIASPKPIANKPLPNRFMLKESQ